MFTLNDLFEILHHGELRGIEEGGNFPDECGRVFGSIKVDDYPKIISHLNLALINLYTEFPLLEKELLLKQQANRTKYILSSKYAVSNPQATTKYIIDSVEEPFTDDIIRINSIYNEYGLDIPLNDNVYCESIFTPSYNTIQVPNPQEGNLLAVMYRAKHPKIALNTEELTTPILLPECFWEAVAFYITSRIHASRASGQELSQLYLSRYYNRLADVRTRNVFGTNVNNTNTKLVSSGWV